MPILNINIDYSLTGTRLIKVKMAPGKEINIGLNDGKYGHRHRGRRGCD